MPDKPDLVIHAGLPKCATTAIQQVLFQNDAALTKTADRTWIGRGMILNGAGAPVSEMMYQPEETMQRIASLNLKSEAKYLISSEALAHRPQMIEALAGRFAISQIILTTRLPCLMALSDYCFSGWLTRPPAQAGLLGRTDSLRQTCEKLKRFAPVTLCPIEPEHLGRRFLGLFCEDIPDSIEADMARLGAANPSTPPALAATLYSVLQDRLTVPVPGHLRSAFTRMAMINRGPPEFARVLPPDIYRVFHDSAAARAEVAAYDAFLADFGVDPHLRDQTQRVCTGKLKELSEKDQVAPDMLSEMRAHSEWFVKRIQKDSPETAALFA